MPNETTLLLHEKLIAWQVACELLRAVREARISDPKLRDQAMRAAQSACLNIAEANGRFARPIASASSPSRGAKLLRRPRRSRSGPCPASALSRPRPRLGGR